MKTKHILMLAIFLINSQIYAGEITIEWAKIQGPKLVHLKYTGEFTFDIIDDINIDPAITLGDIQVKDDTILIHTQTPFRLDTHYYLTFNNQSKQFLIPDGILDSLYSDKPLGYQHTESGYEFRVFAPRAEWVRLVLFDNYDDKQGGEYAMTRDAVGVWESSTMEDWSGKYYGYRLWGPQGEGELFDSTIVVADPYSPAAVTLNHYRHPAKTLIMAENDFDWEGDQWMNIPMRDLIIYEMHVRDMTAHPTSGLLQGVRGHYTSLIYEEQNGGLPYIRDLGVNAVELLPAQDFANIEVPYRDPEAPVFNTWNPYERNHWGYMTSYFFAPESYYASGGTLERGKYNGADGRQIDEFKEMVKAFHRNGIAVLMDVVYNHVSQYDYNPLKYIDKFYYFRLENDCSFKSLSGCGNDLKTERPMARRLILESVKYWMQEYHIDGFRFDLALLIDTETCRQILQEARKINPNVIIIAEPWGGGYGPNEFSDIGWASWNDQFRNGVKGQNPHDGHGFIFGKWQGTNNRKSLERYVMGSLREFGGQYLDIDHSVNYLESHDDHTMSDFIRLGLDEIDEKTSIINIDDHSKLTPLQLKLNKLAAIFLFTSQGAIMMHAGQEFARSKVTAKTVSADSNWGRIDHNSYDKDNETNYINFHHAEMNSELLNYYRGLIQLRSGNAAFRNAKPADIAFNDHPDSLLVAYELNYGNQHFMVAMNGNMNKAHKLALPDGQWKIIADGENVYREDMRETIESEIRIPSSTGVILQKVYNLK